QHLPGDSPQQTTPHYSGGLRAKLDSRSGETQSKVQKQEQSTNRSVSTITVPSPYPACARAYRLMHGLASRRRNFIHVEVQLCTGKWHSRKSRRRVASRTRCKARCGSERPELMRFPWSFYG